MNLIWFIVGSLVGVLITGAFMGLPISTLAFILLLMIGVLAVVMMETSEGQ